MSSGLLLLIKGNFFIIINVYCIHILLNNLIKLALGPFLIKYDYKSLQIGKNHLNAMSLMNTPDDQWTYFLTLCILIMMTITITHTVHHIKIVKIDHIKIDTS